MRGCEAGSNLEPQQVGTKGFVFYTFFCINSLSMGHCVMSDSERKIECPVHGAVYETFVCSHLIDDPQQQWFGDYPTQDKPWPDAWCGVCDREFQKEGEWNEKNEQNIEVKLLCHCCYEEFKGSSVAPLMESRAKHWQRLVSKAVRELERKQDELQKRFDLSQELAP